jgi:hypothetical protein
MLFAQQIEDKTKIKNKIDSIRKDLYQDNLITDSILTRASEMLEIKDLNKLKKVDERNQRDIIKLLGNNHIYDYEIKSIVLEGNTVNEIDFKGNEDLSNVLGNKDFNKIGINILKDNNKIIVKIIITENYISFDKGFSGEARANPGGGPPTEYITVSGTSYVDDLFYETSQLKELPNQYKPNSKEKIRFKDSKYFEKKYQLLRPKEKEIFDKYKPGLKEKMQFKDNKYFELRIDISDRNIKSIVFFNSRGKVLAFLPLRLSG